MSTDRANSPPPEEPSNEPFGEISIPALTGVLAEPWSLKKLVGMLALFGPAAIVASIAIGAGETIMVVRAGSWARYDLLWAVLLACVVKGIFLTYLLGRYTAVCGESIATRLVRLPGPRGWFLIGIVVLEMLMAPLLWTAVAKPCGVLLSFFLQDLMPGWLSTASQQNLFTTLFVGLACAFGLLLSFERLEKQQIVICGILVGGTILGTLMVRPQVWEMIAGSLNIGRVPDVFPSWTPEDARHNPLLTVTTMFGYVGGSLMSYMVYANWVGMHGWGMAAHERIDRIRVHAAKSPKIDYLPDDPQAVRSLRRLLAPLHWDVGMGAVVLFIVAGAFMTAGAAVLYPMFARGEIEPGFEDWDLLTDQAYVWRNVHPGLVWVYYVCILAALWGTLQALPEAYARVTQDFFKAVWPKVNWTYGPIRRVICAYLFVSTTITVWAGLSFDIVTQVVSFLVSNLGLALVMLAVLYLNHQLPKAYRASKPILIGGILSAIVLGVVSAVSGWGLVAKLTVNTGVIHGSVQVDGTERTYRLVIPSSLEDGPAAPLVYAFHGTGDDGEFMAGCTKLDALAAREGFLLVYPEALLGQWKVLQPPQEPNQENVDVRFFDVLHARLLADHSIDPSRVYAVGHSVGGAWVHLLGAVRSDRIAAIVSHSGWIPDRLEAGLNAERRYPALIVQGTADKQVTLRQADAARKLYEAEGHHVEQLSVEGLDHAWAVSHNEQMWEFLERFQLAKAK